MAVTTLPLFTVKRVEWSAASVELHAVRHAVFVEEQQILEELEWDDMEARCVHVLAMSANDAAIGCGRLLPDGHIGRMAVLKPWRGQGVWAALMRELLAVALEQGHTSAELSAQTHAIGFYRRFGFEITSDEYLEVAIPHRAMRLLLSPK